MTTSAAKVYADFGHGFRPADEPPALRVFEYVVGFPVLILLFWQVAVHWEEFASLGPSLVPWLLVVVAADLVPVRMWGTTELMMSFPVLLAAAFVFPPYVAGLVSFLGPVDSREFRRTITFGRALLNRSNVTLSVLVASWVFHQMNGSVTNWPAVLGIAAVSLLVDFSINASLFIVGARFLTGLTPAQLVHNTYGGSRPIAFASGYASFGLLAVVLATLFASVGTWALLAFAIPLVLGRQMFVHWKKLTETESRLDAERRALNQVSSRIADERKDERLTVAAGIHDEVLQPLYKVHLMGHVLRQDLASGRLLDLDSDVPDLLEATDAASRALRDLIGSLRRSTLGTRGLAETLQLLARDLSAESGIRIDVNASVVPGTPLVHLLLYQVTRETLVNAVKHSRATSVRVTLDHSGEEIRVIVEDDGVGFEPSLVDRTSHFGLELMRERVDLAGGKVFIESAADSGTRIIVKVPPGSSVPASE